MNSTYDDKSNYVNSSTTFQDLETYNDYGIFPKKNDI